MKLKETYVDVFPVKSMLINVVVTNITAFKCEEDRMYAYNKDT